MVGKENNEMLHVEDVEKINEMLETIQKNKEQQRTVIVGPSFGKEEKRNTKLRVYSYGAHALELSTTRYAKNILFPGKGWESYNKTLRGCRKYDELNENVLKEMIKTAHDREIKTYKHYKERSAETALIYQNRKKKGNAVLIDMEFTIPEEWITKLAVFDKESKRGKPDLVVFDKIDKSFGLIELKLSNDSTQNMTKHFADFYNMVHSEHSHEIKEELCRRVKYLVEYGIIDKINDEYLNAAKNNPLWSAFLFVEGGEEKCRKTFEENNLPVILTENIKIRRDEFGFLYADSLETEIDYTKKGFGL